ncbi:tRNA pseudouridine synthase-like 1 [Eurosta solidaginis]|uniref:tRNA pseudouridine synthase-like 1 n=1 Tax=Eurosta solidaginis TaxID=178769 RepID=UPI0035305BF5
MYRYLLNISYIGTNFRGIQKIINKSAGGCGDNQTIQGCVELAMQKLHPTNEIDTKLSSRTDSGVHALHSTLHVDLESRNSEPFDPLKITGILNKQFNKKDLPIRVLSTQKVPNTFHCRYNALGRSYLYRFAVAKHRMDDIGKLKNANFNSFIPVEELSRCYFLQNCNFDIERLRAGSRMLLGVHNFRTFASISRQHSPSRDNPRFTLRKIDEINVKSGKTTAIDSNADLAESLYDYWEIEFKARSFLYKQVRRMVGALFALATGRIDERCIYEMLTIPSKNSWDPRVLLAPPFGLYLCRVHYNENDFVAVPQQVEENEFSATAAK